MFTFKDGGGSDGRRGSTRSRVGRRRREAGDKFGDRAYKRAAEREAEKEAEEAAKTDAYGRTKAERIAERKRKEEERKAEKAKREAERAAKEQERRQRQIDLANHQYKDKRIPVGFARKMLDASKNAPTGYANVEDAEKAVQEGAVKPADFPFEGPEKAAFIDYLRDRMPAERLKVYEDGSGFYIDGQGKLYSLQSDDDYARGK